MKKRNTVYEDRAEKEEKRRKKQQEHMERHLVVCPHCNEKVLDHMTKCPKCGGVLVPRGYRPMDPKKEKLFKTVGWTVGIAITVVIVVLIFVYGK